MHKFFVKSTQILDKEVTIADENFNHIKNVLRLAPNEKVYITDDEENEYLAEVRRFEEKTAYLEIIEKIDVKRESNLDITLFQGLPKSDKMELIIQKLTELGLQTITPTQMKRCVVKLENESKESKKIDRWQKIAQEAAKQSKRNRITKIESVKSILKISNWSEYDLILVPYENESKQGLKEVLSNFKQGENLKIAIVVGPEGGFEEAEIEYMMTQNAKIISLGRRILRTETAGIAVVSILQYELGDMGIL